MVEINGNTSDGYHTFNELYYHRMVLFASLLNAYPDRGWKSKFHSDGTMHEGYFVAGIHTPGGEYTYHTEMKYWGMFSCKELDRAPEWDGNIPSDVGRLLSLEPFIFDPYERFTSIPKSIRTIPMKVKHMGKGKTNISFEEEYDM